MNIFNKVTIKSMKKNPVRTLVTIIGIIISTAMFTAVTTLVSSLYSFVYMTQVNGMSVVYIASMMNMQAGLLMTEWKLLLLQRCSDTHYAVQPMNISHIYMLKV